MAITADIPTTRYGTPDGHQPLNKGLQASITIYRGTIAVLNGTGGHQGYLKDPASPATTDLVIGVIDTGGPGYPNTSPGIVGGSTDGAVTANISTGTFLFASGTGADELDVTTNMASVYMIDGQTVGKTNGSSSRPVAGVQMSCNDDDPSIPAGFVAVKLGTPASPLGGP